ncbi:MAG TPA: patatin-like phospholipase family protein [Gammaproteobacteria bacterium]|nr:patatin-like phospholipase family protein [Gammaproteobacteria bacterium]
MGRQSFRRIARALVRVSRIADALARRARVAQALALFATAAPIAHAQAPAAPEPNGAPCVSHVPGEPSIGLALSGGGARGGAHIGVLKALEELRIPVDCIAGTSIGAVIGGFYSTGLSADQLKDILDNLDFNAVYRDLTPRRLESFRRKRDEDLFLVDLRPGLNEGEIQLPIGLVQGQVADTILSRYTLRASEIHDFDNLPIPFRAVAADIATGDPVILASGSLPLSLRASMAIPAALTPVEIDNRLLVDGGIAMNLPIGVAQDMGAGVVIAIDITASLRSREAIRNVVDVTSQLTNLLTRGGLAEQRKLLRDQDVLLTPEFPPDLSSVDFDHMADAVDVGYRTVMQHRDELEKYSLTPEQYGEYLESRVDHLLHDLPRIDFVRLVNKSKIMDSIIETRLRDIMVGQPLDVATVERAIDQVYGLQIFQNVRYRLVTENGETGVEVEVVPRSWGPNYVQLGLEYSSTEDADAIFGLAASYLRTATNPHGGEWRATFAIGDEPALIFDQYQPVGRKGLFFVEPALTFQSSRYEVFDEEQLLTQAQLRDATLEFSGGRELMTWGEVRAGVRRGFGDTKLVVGVDENIPPPDYDRGELFMRFSADTLDAIAFPTRGFLATAEWRASRTGIGADENFDQLLLNASYAKTWGRHTLLSSLRYDTTFSGRAPLNRSFRLGGFLDLSGFNRNQFTGQHVARLGAMYYRRIGDLTFLPAYAGVSVEVGGAWDDRRDISFSNSRWGGSIWAGVDSPVGPIYVGYGRTENGIDAYYVFLGRVF